MHAIRRVAVLALLLSVFAALAGARAESASGLVDHRGQPITEAQFGAEFRLLYFGYTHCPDACPLALQVMSDAIDSLGRLGERITPVFISLDPERDTSKVLGDYIEAFHPRLLAVTGNAAAIGDLARRYGVKFAKAPGTTEQSYSVDHSTMIYLADAEGRVIGRFPHDISPRALGSRVVARMMQAQ